MTSNQFNPYIRRGDVVVYTRQGASVVGVEAGQRPGVIISNNEGNETSPSVMVVPMTSQQKTQLLIHYTITKQKYPFLKRDSTLLCEQITTISKQNITMVLGKLDDYDMAIVDYCISYAAGLKH